MHTPEQNQAFFEGRTAGRCLRGRASNPYDPETQADLCDQWDEGYASGESTRTY